MKYRVVNSSFESAQKPTAHSHSGSHVKSTFEKWTEKFTWLILNNIKQPTTPSCKICQEQRDTQVLTNVLAHQVFKCLAYEDTMRWAHQVFKCLAYVDTMRWAHQVFKCLAYVDTMRDMNTKMLVDRQQ